ncbi:MAG TPA: PAAR domain-containing protein, partial [Nannocystis sp.]
MPDAARISDFHACPKSEPGPVPHVGGPVYTGSADVIIGFLPAARQGDSLVCFPIGPADKIQRGSTTVLINHRPAARRSDPGAHITGDLIVNGCPTVVIGDSPQSFTFRAAARRGTPFCEECERKRREMDARHDSGEPESLDPDTATLDDDEPPPGA